MSSRSGIALNPSTDTTTDYIQSKKNIDPYFKTQLYVEDPGHRTPGLILPNGLSKPGERAHDRNLISAANGIRTDILLIDSTACYHGAITTLQEGIKHCHLELIYYYNQTYEVYTTRYCIHQLATYLSSLSTASLFWFCSIIININIIIIIIIIYVFISHRSE